MTSALQHIAPGLQSSTSSMPSLPYFPPQRLYKNYDESQLQAALSSIAGGMTISRAAEVHHIPITTLKRKKKRLEELTGENLGKNSRRNRSSGHSSSSSLLLGGGSGSPSMVPNPQPTALLANMAYSKRLANISASHSNSNSADATSSSLNLSIDQAFSLNSLSSQTSSQQISQPNSSNNGDALSSKNDVEALLNLECSDEQTPEASFAIEREALFSLNENDGESRGDSSSSKQDAQSIEDSDQTSQDHDSLPVFPGLL